jgi:DNA-binding Lrp family transcriptional regulator
MRDAGRSYQSIADELGLSKPTVYEAIGRALEDLVREPAERVRGQEVKRLDAMLEALWQQARVCDDREIQLKTIDRVIKIQERRAKLLGLDAPERVEHSGDIGDASPQKAREIVNDLFRSIKVGDVALAESAKPASQDAGGPEGGPAAA